MLLCLVSVLFFINPGQNQAEVPPFAKISWWLGNGFRSWLGCLVSMLSNLQMSYLVSEEPVLVREKKKKSSQARNFKTLSFSEPMTETSSPNMFVDSLFPRL